MKSNKLLGILILSAFLAVPWAQADVRLPAIFSDHMVLQRDAAVAVWGWADAGEEVAVSIAGQIKTTKAGSDGKWRVKLDQLAAGGSHTLVIKGRNAITVRDVLIGEVWLASGQSNMQMSMAATENFAQEREAAQFPQFRMFILERKTAREPQADCEGKWIVCSPGTIGGFSGTAYYFGRELQQKLGVPVGMIHASHGGSPIEAWTSLEAQQSHPELERMLKQWEEQGRKFDSVAAHSKFEQAQAAWKQGAEKAKAENRRPPSAPKEPVHPRDDYHHPTALFNAMIAPLIPYTIRGAIWYQGESNAHSEENCRLYATQLPILIADWCGRWGQGAFPFAWVQLPNLSASGRNWPLIRESMLNSSLKKSAPL